MAVMLRNTTGKTLLVEAMRTGNRRRARYELLATLESGQAIDIEEHLDKTIRIAPAPAPESTA